MPTAEVCHRRGLSQATFYKFKAKYGGMEVFDAAKLKALEDDNTKLKRLLADTMLYNVALKDRTCSCLREAQIICLTSSPLGQIC